MVPRFLAGSYERYKQDTALFTTWLAQTAATCGYKPTEIHRQDVTSESAKPGSNNLSGSNGPRLKGKDRKAAKDAAAKENKAKPSMGDAKAEAVTTVKYTVTTRELLDQAKAVAESAVKPRITMPFSLRKVVEKAIGARQRCTEWFQKSKIQNKHSDQQHMHFVKVLEDSLSVLGPCIEDEDSSQQSKKLPKDRENNVSTNLADITNRFERLVVEDTLDVDDVQVSEVIASINTARKTPSSKGKSVIESFELEDESKEDDDLAFRIFCTLTPAEW